MEPNPGRNGAFNFAPWLKNGLRSLWNGLTGQTAVEQQNKANLELAKYQAQLNEDFYNKYSSPEAMMRQYKEAGLNPNLVYGSLGSGQGNVPSFSAPNVERSLSGSDKINKALSSFSNALGLVQGVYQAAASREAAEQSAIKTLNDWTDYNRNRGNLLYDNTLKGGLFDLVENPMRLFGKRTYDHVGRYTGRGTMLERYIGADRSLMMNRALDAAMSNIYNYGYGNYGINDSLHFLDRGIMPYQRSKGLTNQLKYKLTNEIGNMGTYGKLLISFFDLLL